MTQALLRLRRHLEGAGRMGSWRVVEMALDARRPTLRAEHCQGESGRWLPVEVSFDQSLTTLRKSELLARAVAPDPRPLQLARLLRLWAEKRGVVGQRKGHLSGYAVCLLAVFYCQRRGLLGGLAPRKHGELSAFEGRPEEGAGCAAATAAAAAAPGRGTLELLPGLFAFYAGEFDWRREVVSVRLGRRAERRGGGQEALAIEDPVEPGVDLATPYLDWRRNCRLRAEFRRTARLLQGSPGEPGAGVLEAVWQRPRPRV